MNDGPAIRPVALLVHEASVMYVRSVAEFIRLQIATHAGREPLYAECADVSSIAVPDGCVVFLIGEGFPAYVRRSGCRYILINFSLVSRLRWWRPVSAFARGWMRAKRRALIAKRAQYDMLLDFHPGQARLLRRSLRSAGVPVRTFLTNVSDAAPSKPLAARRWDVCFTGTESPRRARMRASLEARGISVSPSVAPGLHTVIGDCRIVANVHYAACDTLEAPRIVHAFAAGTCLVTEPCCGLDDVAPRPCYVRTPYGRMPDAIAHLLDHPDEMDAIARRAAAHHGSDYATRAAGGWRALVDEALAL